LRNHFITAHTDVILLYIGKMRHLTKESHHHVFFFSAVMKRSGSTLSMSVSANQNNAHSYQRHLEYRVLVQSNIHQFANCKTISGLALVYYKNAQADNIRAAIITPTNKCQYLLSLTCLPVRGLRKLSRTARGNPAASVTGAADAADRHFQPTMLQILAAQRSESACPAANKAGLLPAF